MLAPHEAIHVVDSLLEGGMSDVDRDRLGRELRDFIDNVVGDIRMLEVAHQHEASESRRHFAYASQRDDELRTLRGVVGQCKGELAELSDAATRACGLLEGRPLAVEEAEAIAAVRAAMRGKRAHEYTTILSDSVRKFAALTIMHRMLRKLRASEDVYRAADEWAKKQLRL